MPGCARCAGTPAACPLVTSAPKPTTHKARFARRYGGRGVAVSCYRSAGPGRCAAWARGSPFVVRSSSLRSVRPALSLLFMFGWLRRFPWCWLCVACCLLPGASRRAGAWRPCFLSLSQVMPCGRPGASPRSASQSVGVPCSRSAVQALRAGKDSGSNCSRVPVCCLSGFTGSCRGCARSVPVPWSVELPMRDPIRARFAGGPLPVRQHEELPG